MNNSDFVIEDGVLKEYRGNEENVVIPFGVTTIGESAFEHTNIKSVLIPNSVTKIDDEAFASCFRLTEITIPDSIIKIGCGAFADSHSLKTVHISDLTSWCNIDFFGDWSNPLHYAHDLYLNGELIKKLVIPDSVTTIKNSSFKEGSFKEVIIPNSIVTIDTFAFFRCKSLKSVIIPDSVKNIGKYAFDECESLSKIIFKGNLAYLDKTTFEDSINLKEIYVYSENMKKFLESSIRLPDGGKIIIDETLNKDKAISLGSDYLLNSALDSSDYDEKTGSKKLLKDIARGDIL